jgi:hypothetical protein
MTCASAMAGKLLSSIDARIPAETIPLERLEPSKTLADLLLKEVVPIITCLTGEADPSY